MKTRLFIISFVMVMAFSGPSESFSESAPDAALTPGVEKAYLLLKGARLYDNEKDYRDALGLLLKESANAQGNLRVFSGMSIAYAGLKDFVAAVKYRDEVFKAAPELGDAFYAAGVIEGKLFNYESAITAYEKAIAGGSYFAEDAKVEILILKTSLEPTDPAAFFKLGEYYLGVKRYNFAAYAFCEVIGLDPLYSGAHMKLAESYENMQSGTYNARRKNLELAREHYLVELIYNPKTHLRLMGEDSARKRIERRVDLSEFIGKDSAFALAKFPAKGIVAVKSAPIYDFSFGRAGELKKGDIIAIAGLYNKTLTRDGPPLTCGKYIDNLFYVLEDRRGVINVRSVILGGLPQESGYSSPSGMEKVYKTPVGNIFEVYAIKIFKSGLAQVGTDFREYKKNRSFNLWLKTASDEIVFLGVFDEGIAGDDRSHIIWSPNGKYFFISEIGKVFSSDGKLLWAPASGVRYASAQWHDGVLFFRGTEGNDAVYVFDPVRKRFEKFVEFNDLQEGEYNIWQRWNETLRWPPVEFSGGAMKVSFRRQEKEVSGKGACEKFDFTLNGNKDIIKKESKIFNCD